MCQISSQSDYVLVFCSNFYTKCEDKENKVLKIENLAARISEMAGAISFKFWNVDFLS